METLENVRIKLVSNIDFLMKSYKLDADRVAQELSRKVAMAIVVNWVPCDDIDKFQKEFPERMKYHLTEYLK
jgi:hypothetical protein